MNGRVARMIRREVYGVASQREERKYVSIPERGMMIRVVGHRATYQMAKRAYNKARRKEQ